MSIFSKIFGDPNAKVIKELRRTVDKISALEPAVTALSDSDLAAKTAEFKQRLLTGAKLDDLLVEAFAVVREASRRILGQRHYDVQLMGGMVLHQGGIAEMRTGEGKTLTATTAVYLHALEGKGAHVVTVNDYLAKRDAAWMGKLFHFLGLSVGVIQHESGYVFDPEVGLKAMGRREAYHADITYGTNNEFGFDYLRDNMARTEADLVGRDLNFAVVDEVDSILIDEARTPLIISAPAEESADLYYRFADIAKSLVENEDYNIDEKMRTATFTEAGFKKVEVALGIQNLYEQGLEQVHHAEQALRAQALFKNDREYVVRDGEVVIVDEFTGRLMEGRRYSDGLHQAIEAKEGVKIQRESKTLATITFQNYFRLYKTLSGMTGTAATEAEEFSKIYKLEVTQIPTNRPNIRVDLADRIYKSERGRWRAVVAEVAERHATGQPILIGTTSIDKNQLLSQLLTAAGISHKILNAKNHEQEAEIIAQAGRRGAVTLATNMAGRGVDILLGGNPVDPAEAEAVRSLGGLHVIGTARHESRRIDNQLRGRAGRQGDPGSTQFFVSLDDDLMRIFGSERVKSMMDTLGLDEDTPIESKMVTKSLGKSQERVEGHNFDTRKHVLEYDDVLNKHRLTVYAERRQLLLGTGGDSLPEVIKIIDSELERVLFFHTAKNRAETPEAFSEESTGDWNPKEIIESFNTIVPLSPETKTEIENTLGQLSINKDELLSQRTRVIELMTTALSARVEEAKARLEDDSIIERIARNLRLRTIDGAWMRHLSDMTYLRRTIGLQGYAQRDPLVEYKRESFRLYNTMREDINREVAYNFFKALDQNITAKAIMAAMPKIVETAQAMLNSQPDSDKPDGSVKTTIGG